MCGIAGIIAGDNAARMEIASEVRAMCAEIVYRGPDDEGIYVDGTVGLGMRRLSIIDVSTGQQPIHNEDRTLWVVFNGEIYNFGELRRELEANGHTFYTNSDTEVIVHAYEAYGSDCVSRLRGMFAFALYDFRQRKLVLARDRLGKKPLHYAIHNGTLYFGSEIKSIIAVAPQLATMDRSALAEFFYCGYIPDPHTVFSAIKKLPQGHCLEFEDNSVRLTRYWDPKFVSTARPQSEYLEQLEATLEDAVRMRLISEVPLGALLSGGVDSSTVVAMMARVSNRPVKTFSIGFTQTDSSEAEHARSVATRFGTDHHELVVDADLWNTLDILTGIIDEPLADSSVIPTYHVARMARKHVTVVLSGDGGDELFTGYDSYLTHYRRRHLGIIPRRVGPVYHKYLYPFIPLKLRDRKLAYNFVLNSRERFLSGKAVLPNYDAELTILSPEFLRLVAHDEPPETIFRTHYDNCSSTDPLSRMQYTDIKTYLPADVLTKVDRMSMACSLEVRCPLLDHVFVELAIRIPTSMKIRNGVGKYLLRCLATKLGVPSQTLDRPKQGFGLPLKHWFRNALRDDMAALLLEPRTLQRGYFRKSAIERLLSEHRRGERDHSSALWLLLSFELWHRNYLERRTKRQSASATVLAGPASV
jgi:asparagine synthase (glutamine-hydrolysing)